MGVFLFAVRVVYAAYCSVKLCGVGFVVQCVQELEPSPLLLFCDFVPNLCV